MSLRPAQRFQFSATDSVRTAVALKWKVRRVLDSNNADEGERLTGVLNGLLATMSQTEKAAYRERVESEITPVGSP